MSETKLEPGSLEFKMNTAVLRVNTRLRENGFNERERAAMWGMTVSELRVFLTQVWEHLHNDKTVGHVGEELDLTKAEQDAQIDKIHGPGAAAALEEAIADGSIFSENNPKKEGADEQSGANEPGKTGSDIPKPKPPRNSDGPAGTVRTQS